MENNVGYWQGVGRILILLGVGKLIRGFQFLPPPIMVQQPAHLFQDQVLGADHPVILHLTCKNTEFFVFFLLPYGIKFLPIWDIALDSEISHAQRRKRLHSLLLFAMLAMQCHTGGHTVQALILIMLHGMLHGKNVCPHLKSQIILNLVCWVLPREEFWRTQRKPLIQGRD